jgi:hypothetical protein
MGQESNQRIARCQDDDLLYRSLEVECRLRGSDQLGDGAAG